MDDGSHPAAESMLQHSRSARSSSQALNGFAMPESYPLDTSQAQARMNQIVAVPIQTYSHFRHPFRSTSVQEQGFGAAFDGSSPHDTPAQYDHHARDSTAGSVIGDGRGGPGLAPGNYMSPPETRQSLPFSCYPCVPFLHANGLCTYHHHHHHNHNHQSTSS